MEDSEKLYLKAEKLYHQPEKQREAISLFREYLLVKPGDTNAWKYLATLCASVHDYDACMEACNRAIALQPDNAGLWSHKELMLSAISSFEYHPPFFFDPKDKHCEGFSIKYFSGMPAVYEERLKCIEFLMREKNNAVRQTRLIDQKVMMLKKLQRFEEAIHLLKENFRLYMELPDDSIFHPEASVYFDLGKLYEAAGNIQEAARYFESAYHVTGEEIYLTHLGKAYLLAGDKLNAQKYYHTFLDLVQQKFKETKDPAYIFQSISAYLELGRIEDAKRALEEIVPLTKKRPYLEKKVEELRKELEAINSKN